MTKKKRVSILILLSVCILSFCLLSFDIFAEEKADVTAKNDINTLTQEDIKTMSSEGIVFISPAGGSSQVRVSTASPNGMTTPSGAQVMSNELLPPTTPVISEKDSVVTIEPGRSTIGFNEIPNTQIEDFEDKRYLFTKSGNWFLTSEAKSTGKYSYRSYYVWKDAASVCSFSINVPADAINPKVSFNFALSGRAQNDYFFVGLDNNWLWTTTELLNSWYNITMDLQAGKTNIVNAAFYKKDYCWDGFNTAFIDNLKLTYSSCQYIYGDIQRAQYKINGGVWQDYLKPFIPYMTGEITITARTVDANGMYSPEVSKVVTIKRNLLMEATLKVEELEGMLSSLDSQEKIDNAQKMLNEARELVNALPDIPEKTLLLDRLNTAQLKINIATVTLMVQEVEKATFNLESQELVNNARNLYEMALNMANSLPECTQRTSLLERLNIAKLKIDIAQVDLKIKTAENLVSELGTWDSCEKAQSAYNIAVELVAVLPECPQKSIFVERLNAVQLLIDIARATIKVEAAENSISQESAEFARQYIHKLPDGEIKSSLQVRIDFVQKVIDATNQVTLIKIAYTQFERILFQNDLTSKESINQLKLLLADLNGECSGANTLVSSLPATDKQILSLRIEELKQYIASTQALLNVTLIILNDSALPFSGNGSYRKDNGAEIKMLKGSTINLIIRYKDFLISQLKTIDSLKLVSFDFNNITVTQDGNVTAISNGLSRVTVYNKNGKVDFYIISTGNNP